MNRKRAKLLTLTGIFCCSASLIYSIFNFARIADSYHFPLLFFVVGIVLIFVSLAFYTEK